MPYLSEADKNWRDFNKQLLQAFKQSDYSAASSLYFEMALQLYKEGKKFFPPLQDSAKMKILSLKQSGVIKSLEILAGDCPSCQKLSGKKYSFDQALKEMPIPNKDCSFELESGKPGWCRCMWISSEISID